MTTTAAVSPLNGIKVVEIGQNIAGPYASEILSSLGAEVIKIERPVTGDDARGWGPPFWRGTATTFQAMNHGKKSIALDLKNEKHLASLKELIRTADVFIQNKVIHSKFRLKCKYNFFHFTNPLIFITMKKWHLKGGVIKRMGIGVPVPCLNP